MNCKKCAGLRVEVEWLRDTIRTIWQLEGKALCERDELKKEVESLKKEVERLRDIAEAMTMLYMKS